MPRWLSVTLALLMMIPAANAWAEELELPQTLVAAKSTLQDKLNRLDKDLEDTARELSGTGLDSWSAGRAMGRLRNAQSQIVNCATIDPQGVMLRIVPREYSGSEGVNITSQPQVAYMLREHKPVISDLFQTVEGFWGIDLQRPIFDRKGKFMGSLSVMFSPMAITHEVVEMLPTGGGSNIWLIQTDGLVLYYQPLEGIGQNILQTKLFKSFAKVRALAQRIVKDPLGMGGPPHFLPEKKGGPPLDRMSHWTSVGLHGKQWRLGLSQYATSKQ